MIDMKGFGKNLNLKLRNENKSFGNNKKTFVKLVDTFDQLVQRTYSIEEEVGIIMEKYEEPFFILIESLFYLNYEDWKAELVMWYVYDRWDDEGELSPLNITDIEAGTEEEIIIKTPGELYDLLKRIDKKGKK
jgi:hypothetical protein